MGKTNWNRVFLGGLLAGLVSIVIGFATWAIYLGNLWTPALEGLGHPLQESGGVYVLAVVMSFVGGILAVWLYSAIRPRYGAGAKTAVIAGFAVWLFGGLLPAISYGSMGLFPGNVLVIDSLTYLVVLIVSTLAGAWVYREQAQ
jgi:hypothetical protein